MRSQILTRCPTGRLVGLVTGIRVFSLVQLTGNVRFRTLKFSDAEFQGKSPCFVLYVFALS